MAAETELTKDEVKALIEEKGYQLNYDTEIPEAFKCDVEVIAWILAKGSLSFTSLPEVAQANREIALLFASESPYYFHKFSERFRDDREIALIAVKNNSSSFEHFSDRLRSDREIVELALTDSGYLLKHVKSDELMHDRELLKLALSTHHQAFMYIPEDLRDDEELLQQVIDGEINGLVFGLFPESYRDNKEVALKAVQDDAGSLNYVSTRLADDVEIVRAAVKKRGMMLQYASERLRDDKETVLIALRGQDTGCVVSKMSDRLKHDKEIVIAAVSIDNRVLGRLPEEFYDDEDVVNACMLERKSNFNDNMFVQSSAYKYFGSDFKSNRNIALAMSQGIRFPLKSVPECLSTDREIVLNAIKSDHNNYQHVAPELLEDLDFVRALWKANDDILNHMDEALKSRLFTTRIVTATHHGRAVVVELVIDDGYVKAQRRAANTVQVVQDGKVVLSCSDFPLITYEENGPIGSYLSVRYLNNIVLCGDFVFFVAKNSEDETFTNHLGGRMTTAQTSDAFLKHTVYLIDTGKLTTSLDIKAPGDGAKRIYFGRKANLVTGVQAFQDSEEYRSALTILNQEHQYREPAFDRVDAHELKVNNSDADELNGAARVYLDEHGWRWLLPNDAGAFAALDVLMKTDDSADWQWLKQHVSTATEAQRALLITHFASTSFASEVEESCK